MSGPAVPGHTGPDPAELVDSPAFVELLADRRRFFRPASLAFALGIAAFLVLPALGPDLFAAPVGGGATVGIVLGVLYTVLVFALVAWYRSRARRWDELAARVRHDFEGRAR
jgi:uncharacterized membrane protein (DUF485 family)